MKLHSSHLVRYLVTGLLFLASLIVQVNLVYACQMMEQMPSTSCCCDEPAPNECPMGGDCNSTAQTASESCCHVDAGVTSGTSLSNTVSANPAGYDTRTFYPPFLVLPVTEQSTLIVDPSPSFMLAFGPVGSHGTDTYLVTQRFRE